MGQVSSLAWPLSGAKSPVTEGERGISSEMPQSLGGKLFVELREERKDKLFI